MNVDVQMHASSIVRVVSNESNWFIYIIFVILRECLTEEVLQQYKQWQLYENLKALNRNNY